MVVTGFNWSCTPTPHCPEWDRRYALLLVVLIHRYFNQQFWDQGYRSKRLMCPKPSLSSHPYVCLHAHTGHQPQTSPQMGHVFRQCSHHPHRALRNPEATRLTTVLQANPVCSVCFTQEGLSAEDSTSP